MYSKISIFLILSLKSTFSSEIRSNFTDSSCKCLPFYLCSEETGEIITDGGGLLDLRNFKENVCTGDFDVCCNISKDEMTTIPENSIHNKGCGYQKPGSFPWSAALLYQAKDQFTPSYKCGVSVIHSKVILTAAHCLDDENGFYAVRIGNFIRRVSEKFVHPKFSAASLQNDIALLFLDKPVDVAPICIPPKGISMKIDEKCLAIGTVSGHHGNPVLSMIELPIVDRNSCEKRLKTTRLGEFFKLHKSFICAGGESNRDTCGGDGGSPLVCSVPGQPERFHQIGIVSWGIGCGNKLPGVYVNLPYFRQWIDRIMIANKLDITFYRY